MKLSTTDSDREFYRKLIRPLLPDRILDFHAHVWKPDHWKGYDRSQTAEGLSSTSVTEERSARYMTTEIEFSVEMLKACADEIFPGVAYHAVVFGQPTPTADTERTNAYASGSRETGDYYPLMIPIPGNRTAADLAAAVNEGGYYGFKVFLNWIGNAYIDVKVEDMVTDLEMGVADDLRLVVLLHVPGSDRLAATCVQESITRYARGYPNAKIVLAHCGRCYDQERMLRAMDFLADLDNVYMDSSMVMDHGVIKLVFDAIGPKRLLFGTDFPVAVMKGRRVQVMDHWIDVVSTGYPDADYRIASDTIQMTYMAYEIILAIRRGAQLAGISEAELRGVFAENGFNLLRSVPSAGA